MKLFIIFILAAFLSAHTITMIHKPIPKLSKMEKRFKSFKLYSRRDFHLGWKVDYFDVVSFNTLPFDGKHFKLPEGKATFIKLLYVGNPRMNLNKKSMQHLAKAIMNSNYFWKFPQPLLNNYTFYSLRFIDADDGKLKAIETLDEVRQFLGKIDTEAELLLWIMVSEDPFRRAYSYKKFGNTYRVRFLDSDLGRCYFYEYFRYYDENGNVIKKRTIRKVHIKGCAEAVI